MLNGQEYEYNKYKTALEYIAKKIPKYAFLGGIGSGVFYAVQFFAYSWAFWYGSHCSQATYMCPISVTGSRYTSGDVISVFFAMFTGSYNFMQLIPSLQKIYNGMFCAYRIY